MTGIITGPEQQQQQTQPPVTSNSKCKHMLTNTTQTHWPEFDRARGQAQVNEVSKTNLCIYLLGLLLSRKCHLVKLLLSRHGVLLTSLGFTRVSLRAAPESCKWS